MSGTKDKVKGKLKGVAGVLTNDRALEREGKVDQAIGSLKQTFEGAVDTVRNAVSPRSVAKRRAAKARRG